MSAIKLTDCLAVVLHFPRVGRVMGSPPAQVALNHMTQTDAGPVIIEGDCILPSLEGEIKKLATSRGNPGITDRVRRAFVVHRDEDDVLERVAGRRRGRSDRGDRDLKANHAKAVAAFGRRIEEEAVALGDRMIDGASPSAFEELLKLATE